MEFISPKVAQILSLDLDPQICFGMKCIQPQTGLTRILIGRSELELKIWVTSSRWFAVLLRLIWQSKPVNWELNERIEWMLQKFGEER